MRLLLSQRYSVFSSLAFLCVPDESRVTVKWSFLLHTLTLTPQYPICPLPSWTSYFAQPFSQGTLIELLWRTFSTANLSLP